MWFELLLSWSLMQHMYPCHSLVQCSNCSSFTSTLTCKDPGCMLPEYHVFLSRPTYWDNFCSTVSASPNFVMWLVHCRYHSAYDKVREMVWQNVLSCVILTGHFSKMTGLCSRFTAFKGSKCKQSIPKRILPVVSYFNWVEVSIASSLSYWEIQFWTPF